jgi:hypothetical protein
VSSDKYFRAVQYVGQLKERHRNGDGLSRDELLSAKELIDSAIHGPQCDNDLAILVLSEHDINKVIDDLYGYDISKLDLNKINPRQGTFLLGSLLAFVVSYADNHSIPWALFHALLGWAYLIYSVLRKYLSS